MLSVSHDPAIVESQLLSGQLLCPECGEALKPWGSGARRVIRYGTPALTRSVTPRRARCTGCFATHILLPAVLAARRADEAAVIAHAVELNVAAGWGHQRIADRLGRPLSTVRGWLRDFQANAPVILENMATRVHAATAEALGFWPAPAASVAADALAMLVAHAQVLAHQHRPDQYQQSQRSNPVQAAGSAGAPVVRVTWCQAALLAVGPWLFSRVGWS